MAKIIKPYELLKSTLDGTWSKLWKEAQKRPEHLIDNKNNNITCTCGKGPFESMKDWSDHACGVIYNEYRRKLSC